MVKKNKSKKEPISNINIFVTILEDLDPLSEYEDQWPTL